MGIITKKSVWLITLWFSVRLITLRDTVTHAQPKIKYNLLRVDSRNLGIDRNVCIIFNTNNGKIDVYITSGAKYSITQYGHIPS